MDLHGAGSGHERLGPTLDTAKAGESALKKGGDASAVVEPLDELRRRGGNEDRAIVARDGLGSAGDEEHIPPTIAAELVEADGFGISLGRDEVEEIGALATFALCGKVSHLAGFAMAAENLDAAVDGGVGFAVESGEVVREREELAVKLIAEIASQSGGIEQAALHLGVALLEAVADAGGLPTIGDGLAAVFGLLRGDFFDAEACPASS